MISLINGDNPPPKKGDVLTSLGVCWHIAHGKTDETSLHVSKRSFDAGGISLVFLICSLFWPPARESWAAPHKPPSCSAPNNPDGFLDELHSGHCKGTGYRDLYRFWLGFTSFILFRMVLISFSCTVLWSYIGPIAVSKGFWWFPEEKIRLPCSGQKKTFSLQKPP